MSENFLRMPLGQVKFLLKITASPTLTAFAEGKSQGGCSKELAKKGFIQPFGVVDRRIRWKLVKAISDEDIKLLKELSK